MLRQATEGATGKSQEPRLINDRQVGRHRRRLRRSFERHSRDGEGCVCDEEWGGLSEGLKGVGYKRPSFAWAFFISPRHSATAL